MEIVYNLQRRGWSGLAVRSLALLAVAATSLCTHSRAARAGIADTPLPVFADGKQSIRVLAVSGVVKRAALQTDFLCTSFDSVPVDIGVEIFDTGGGPPLNSIAAGSGAVLDVVPGQTVTMGTSATAAFLESTTIALAAVAQGSARVVASSSKVRCNVVVLDDTVSPPVALTALGPAAQPAAGAMPPSLALPQFSNGHAATHSLLFPGLAKRGRVQTVVFCTSLAAANIDLGLEVLGPDGVVLSSIAGDNGAVLSVAPGATVTFGTTGTAAFWETEVIVTAGVAQGAARVVSTSGEVLCSAVVLDPDVASPIAMSGLVPAAAAPTTAALPRPLPAFSDGKPSVAVMTVPGVVKRPRLQTEVICTSTASAPIDIGVEIFDSGGTLLNNVNAGAGAILGVAPGRTVTFGTSGTAAFLEQVILPITGVSQGVARIVASSKALRCNTVLTDDAVSPPESLATLAEGIQPVAGAVPPARPLPSFADGKVATHAAVLAGAVKRGSVEMAFLCTSLASNPIDIGVEVFGADGTLLNDVAAGNGAVLGVSPAATVTIGTTGTAALLESRILVLPPVAQGFARIVSTSGLVACNALVLDAVLIPPASMSGMALEVLGGTAPTPTTTRTATATRTPSPSPTPSNTSTRTATRSATPTPTSTSTRTSTPSSTATASPSSTATPTATYSATPTPSNTNTRTVTPSATSAATPTGTTTQTAPPIATPIPSGTNTRTPTPSSTSTATPSNSATRTAPPSTTPTPSSTTTYTPTRSSTATATPTASHTGSPTHSFSPTTTRTQTSSPTHSPSPTQTRTSTGTATATVTATNEPTKTPRRARRRRRVRPLRHTLSSADQRRHAGVTTTFAAACHR